MNRANHLNFSGGPGALPETVLRQTREAIESVPGVGLSILGISHRSDWFAQILQETQDNIRTLLGLTKRHHVLLLQGGATQQFSMVPMAMLREDGHAASYLQTGYWSAKPIADARRVGPVEIAWSGEALGYRRLPDDEEIAFGGDASYLHYVSNETVEGLQFHRVLGPDSVKRVCDMSSDLLSRPCEAERFAIIYAHAQKNLGPSGVTIAIVADDAIDPEYPDLPDFLNYRAQIAAGSNLNTPPVFSIYVTLLSTRWILNDIGGLANMAVRNDAKAQLMYQILDGSDGFYAGRAPKGDRSSMNVSFNLPTPELEREFLSLSHEAGFSGLGGHRSIGGIRASLYNGLELSAVEELAEFMRKYQNLRRS